LVLALVAWEQVGSAPGDRIEHGSVVPAELVGAVGDLGLTVVTQPGFIAARGDDYLRDVEADDLEHLYRCATLEQGGVRVAGSTDAPYGPADPWVAMRAAVDRAAPSGAVVGAQERVTPVRALELFLGPLERPADPPRRVEPGMRADLCLLDIPLAAGLDELSSAHVRATWAGGVLVHGDF
jgi:predicted amidohydrolase YtcJ